VYLTGFVITARAVFADIEPGDNRGECRVAAFFLGALWPLVLAVWAVAGLVILPTLGVKPRTDRAMEAETARWERAKLETRIAELERDAGIGGMTP
jgi:hypothetical protein